MCVAMRVCASACVSVCVQGSVTAPDLATLAASGQPPRAGYDEYKSTNDAILVF